MKKLLCAALALAFCLFAFFGCDKGDNGEWERQVREYRNAKRAIYLEENERYADYEVDVAFLGDSLTDLYDVKKYYPELCVSNRGIGGDTTFDLEGRLDYSVYDLKPKVVFMLIGVNNITSMLDNYEQILIGLKDNLPNTRVVLISLTPTSGEVWGECNKLAAYNNVMISLFAEKYGFGYVDLYSALMDVGSGEIRQEYTLDGCHFTDAGYDVITSVLSPTVMSEVEAWRLENGAAAPTP